jgi:colicin import membrane protein
MNVTVVSKSERGHFRAGRFWPSQPVAADVTEKQLAELKADKRIAVLDGSAPSADAVVEKLAAEKAAEKAEAERQATERAPAEKQRAEARRGSR